MKHNNTKKTKYTLKGRHRKHSKLQHNVTVDHYNIRISRLCIHGRIWFL